MNLTRDQLMDLLTTAATVGWDRCATGESHTRGDLTRQIEVSMSRTLNYLDKATQYALIVGDPVTGIKLYAVTGEDDPGIEEHFANETWWVVPIIKSLVRECTCSAIDHASCLCGLSYRDFLTQRHTSKS